MTTDGMTQPIIVNAPPANGVNGVFGNGGGVLEGLLLGLLGGGNGGLFGGARRNGECCDSQTDLARQIAEATANIVQATQSQNIAAIAATNAAAQMAQEIASETRSDVNRIEGAIELSVAQSEGRIGSAVERNGGDTRMSVERNGGDTRSAVERNAGEIRQNVSDGNAETRRQISDSHTTMLQAMLTASAELRNIAAVNNAAQLLEIERSKFATIEARCALERQAAENLARIQHEAAENKYQLATKMAECCCEIKEHVASEGSRTRALIEKNEIDRLREQLEHARREVDHHRHNEAVRVSVSQFLNTGTITRPAPAPVAA